MQSTYRRGAVKSLPVDEGGADGELERGIKDELAGKLGNPGRKL